MNLQEAKAQSTLNVQMRYDGVIMTRRQWIEEKHKEGWKANCIIRKNAAAMEKMKEWLYNNRDMNSANPNYPQTKYYLQQKGIYEAGITKTLYRIEKDKESFYDITKTEFDYFNSINN